MTKPMKFVRKRAKLQEVSIHLGETPRRNTHVKEDQLGDGQPHASSGVNEIRTIVKMPSTPTAQYDLGTGRYLSSLLRVGYLESWRR